MTATPPRDIAFRLALLTLLAFAPSVANGFVDWDDQTNILNNADFRGLGWPQLRWAWTTFLLGVYQPLAWMLLEAQWVVWGLKGSGYHLTSVALHAANALVLFGLIRDLLARARPDWSREAPGTLAMAAGLAAAAFAMHPLRVEAVAWVSCQPYLPCALFAMLAVRAYLKAHPAGGPTRWGWWWAALGLFAASCLSKAVGAGVALAFVVLDAYPLGRFGLRSALEKLPFLAIAAACLAVAYEAKQREEVFLTLGRFGIEQRIAQAGYGAIFYLEKTVVPAGITIYYPVPPEVRLADPQFAVRVAAAIGLTVVALLLRKRCPGLLAAWVAYLAILAPNLGLARIGDQIAADRYGYLPMIGFTALLASGLFLGLRQFGRPFLLATLLIIAPLAVLTARQCLAWRDSLSLWSHAYAHGAADNAVVNLGLGLAKGEAGDLAGAEAHYRRAIELRPEQGRPRNNLGLLLIYRGDFDAGLEQIREAARLRPDNVGFRRSLGYALWESGDIEGARAEFAEAARLAPKNADARMRLAIALDALDRDDEAEAEFAGAAGLAPEDPDLLRTWGEMRARRGRFAEAEVPLAAVHRQRPDDADARSLLAWAIHQQGRTAEAIGHWTEILQRRPGHADSRARLARALASLGRKEVALAQAREALRLVPDHPLARQVEGELNKEVKEDQEENKRISY